MQELGTKFATLLGLSCDSNSQHPSPLCLSLHMELKLLEVKEICPGMHTDHSHSSTESVDLCTSGTSCHLHSKDSYPHIL